MSSQKKTNNQQTTYYFDKLLNILNASLPKKSLPNIAQEVVTIRGLRSVDLQVRILELGHQHRVALPADRRLRAPHARTGGREGDGEGKGRAAKEVFVGFCRSCDEFMLLTVDCLLSRF